MVRKKSFFVEKITQAEAAKALGFVMLANFCQPL